MIRFNRDTYFSAVRESLFGGTLTQEQVDGQTIILSVWEYQVETGNLPEDLRWLAYMLATAYHETAYRMWPIEEYGKGEGRDYGEPDPETGQAYYGRGLVQLTWRDNYARATDILKLEGERDIEWHAEHALDILIATKTMFQGMRDGWFTSKALPDYFNEGRDDPVNARQIINGNDKDTVIAGYHDEFLLALDSSMEEAAPPAPPTSSPPVLTVRLESDKPTQLHIMEGKNARVIAVTPGI